MNPLRIRPLKGKNLRKPFRVMVTVDKNEYGKPITKLLKPEAYFETYNDAYLALVEYNKNPYRLDEDVTVDELYHRWMEAKQELISPSTKRDLNIFWKNAAPLHEIPVRELRAHHIKKWLDESLIAPTVRLRIKNVLNQMLDYAPVDTYSSSY